MRTIRIDRGCVLKTHKESLRLSNKRTSDSINNRHRIRTDSSPTMHRRQGAHGKMLPLPRHRGHGSESIRELPAPAGRNAPHPDPATVPKGQQGGGTAARLAGPSSVTLMTSDTTEHALTPRSSHRAPRRLPEGVENTSAQKPRPWMLTAGLCIIAKLWTSRDVPR